MALPTAAVMPTQRTPFQIGGGQVNTMAAGNDPGGGMNYMQAPGIGDLGSFQRGGLNDPMTGTGTGYDGSGINPGTPTTPPPITPPAGPMPTIPPGNVPPPTPVPPPSIGATAASPLAPLNDYQARQGQSSYQSPTFQGGNSYQAGSYNAPQVAMPQLQGYQAQGAQAP